jgi:sugar transferase (PEP-CTERM system associated)
MSTTTKHGHGQLPVGMLAGMELIIFGAALELAARLLQTFGDNATEAAGAGLTRSLPAVLLFLTAMSFAMAAMGLYNLRQVLTPAGLLIRVAMAATGGTLLIAAVSRMFLELYISSDVLLTGAALVIAGSFTWHFILDRIARDNAIKHRVIVYGSGRRAAHLLQLASRRADRRALNIVGFIPSVGDDSDAGLDDRRIELRTTLHQYCREHQISEIIVAMDDSRWGIPFNAFLECSLAGVVVTELTAFLERETGKVRVDLAHPSWTVFAGGFRQNSLQSRLERGFDVFASLVLLAVSWPVMLLTILAIKIEDGVGAPVLYRQVRVGERGQPFRLLKFRSMREDAERDGARWAATNDHRVTHVGRVIRKLRIDELPQILNVLTGQMSLVGPRPERPEFVSHLDRTIPFYCDRHTIKPGITGWAQLCYPYGADETDAAEKLQYDLFYVKNRTLLLYLAILLQTVEVVLCGKGAR